MAPQGGLEPPAVGVEARCSSNRAATADGTAGRDRTGTLPVRTGMLVRSSCCGMASRGGLEPPTSGFGGRCSSDWATTTVGLEGWIRTIVAGSVDRHPSVRRPREMDPAAGIGPASPPWQGGVVAVGQREDGTDDRNRTRLDWFWKPAPTQSATSVENDLLRPKPPWGTRPSRVARPAARKYRRRSRRCRWRRAQGEHGRSRAQPDALWGIRRPERRQEADAKGCTCRSRGVRDPWLATRCRR